MPSDSDAMEEDATEQGPQRKRARSAGHPGGTVLVLEPVAFGSSGVAPAQTENGSILSFDGRNDPAEAISEATSLREFNEKQRDVLKELHALYQEEYYALLNELKTTYSSFCSSGKPVIKPGHARAPQPGTTPQHACTADDDIRSILTTHRHTRQQQPDQHNNQQQQAPQLDTHASPLPAPRPTVHEASAACSADTSAGRAVASLNNWVGALPSSGTPQSGMRVDGSSQGPSSSQGAASSGAKETPRPAPPTAAAVVPLTPIAEEPPGTPALRAPPAEEQEGQQQQQAEAAAAGDAAAAAAGIPTASAPPVGDQPAAQGEEQQPTAMDASGPGTVQQPSTSLTENGHAPNHAPAQADSTSQPQPGASRAAPPLYNAMQTPTSTRPAAQQHPQLPLPALTLDDTLDTFSDAEDALVSLGQLGPGAGGAGRPEGVGPGAADGDTAGVASKRARFGGAAGVERLLKLETLASAITEQELDMQDALACLVGRTGRYLIRQNTVLLGRNTDTKGEADIDLSEAGCTTQVCRRQAYLTARPDASWALTNAGRKVMHVDGVPLAQFEVAGVRHGSLIEVGGLQLQLMVNMGACERMLRRTVRGTV